jgi:hypothetical protein
MLTLRSFDPATGRLTGLMSGNAKVAPEAGSMTFLYDPSGNMTFRSDLGVMSYGPAGGGGVPAGQTGPHALASLQVDATASPYYAELAQSATTSGCQAMRCYSWTSFGRASAVVEGPNTLAFSYDDGHQRVTQRQTGTVNQTTGYFWGPGVYAEQVTPASGPAGTGSWNDYVFFGGQLVGLVVNPNGNAGVTAQTLYFHDDAQGTITAITGTASEADSWEAYGKQRQAGGAPDTSGTSSTCGLAASDAVSTSDALTIGDLPGEALYEIGDAISWQFREWLRACPKMC